MADAGGSFLLRIGSVSLSRAGGRKPCTLLRAARHNLREGQEERGGRAHIVADRTHLNEVLVGPKRAEDIVALSLELMVRAGVDVGRLRVDHVQAVELLFSLSANHSLNEEAYFPSCVAWAASRFGQDNILSAVVHRDEPAPHCHVLVLPLVDGRMAGGDLKRVRAVAAMVDSFFDEVGRRYGLSRGSQRLTAVQRRTLAKSVLEKLNATRDPCLSSPAWQAIRDAIEAVPQSFAEALGVPLSALPLPGKEMRTMAQIFTSPGKGAKHEVPERRQKAIAFEREYPAD